MAILLQTQIPLVSTIAILLMAANEARSPPKRTSFTYNFTAGEQTGLTYQGDAHYPWETTCLRLTQTDDISTALPYTTGRVLYSKPVRLWDNQKHASFQTAVKFIIQPNYNSHNPGDGLVFFIAPVNSTVEASGGSFGIFDSMGKNPSVFAVEFDIYSNDWDPIECHVGIDIKSQLSSSVVEVGEAMLGKEVTAGINYDAATNLISVRGTASEKTFEVSYVYDLSTILPQQVQVGISASSGMCVALHDVISWSFSSTMVHRKA